MLVDDLKAKLVAINAKFDSYVAANAAGIALGLKAIEADKVDNAAALANQAAAQELLAQNAQLGDVGTALDALDQKLADQLAISPPPPSTVLPPRVDNGSLDLADGQTLHASAETAAATPPPFIASISPTSGPAGSSVAISGSGFTGATAIRFNHLGAVGDEDSTTNDTLITGVLVPASLSGTVSVTIETPAGVSNVYSFTVTAAPPVLTVVPSATAPAEPADPNVDATDPTPPAAA